MNATAQTDEVLRGEDLRVMVDAQYFFGGSVSDATVDYVVEAQPYTFNYEGEGRYSFRDVEPYTSYQSSAFGQRIADGSAETDAAGQALLSLSTTSTQYEGSQRYTVETTVSDESGFPVSDRTTAVVHASSVYVGVGVDGYVGRVGETTTANIIAVDWDSVPVADQSVDVTIEEWRWNTVQEVDDRGRVVYRSEVEQIEVATDTVTTDDDGQATYEFTPESGGLYRIETTTRDTDGNEVTAARLLWVSGRNYVSWRQENDRTIELVADADDYDVGDTAEILITSPFQGEAQALVTVEREGVLQTETVTLDSNSYVYELPITEDFAPNVFVGVMLVKGVDENNPVASFRYGMTQLNVETERKVLTIEAEPDVEQAEPQETVTYTIRTTDYRGEPVSAQVGLGLTDLAVLSVTGPNSGPILDRFYGLQSLSVLTSTPLTINTDEITQNIEEVFKGGGGGGGAAGVFEIRGDFVTTPYWNPDLVTDEDGTATVEVTLPDNLTTWRLDARGFTLGEDDTFLVGQRDVRPGFDQAATGAPGDAALLRGG